MRAAALPPIAAARQEINDAARALGGQTAALSGPQATEARVRGLLGGRDLLHFSAPSALKGSGYCAARFFTSSSIHAL